MVSHRKIDDRSLPVRDLSCAKELPADHRAFVEPGIKVVAVQEQLEMAWSTLVPFFLAVPTGRDQCDQIWQNFATLAKF